MFKPAGRTSLPEDTHGVKYQETTVRELCCRREGPVSILGGGIMVHDAIDQTVVNAFRNVCLRADLVVPLQLWQTDGLPGWFRRTVRADGGHPGEWL